MDSALRTMFMEHLKFDVERPELAESLGGPGEWEATRSHWLTLLFYLRLRQGVR
jgi:hypothetical protein